MRGESGILDRATRLAAKAQGPARQAEGAAQAAASFKSEILTFGAPAQAGAIRTQAATWPSAIGR
jgi:hypothetical protein